MARYRTRLPHLEEGLYLTDGGLETTLIFHEGIDLPDFAAFHLLKDEAGRAALRKYYQTYLDMARGHGAGIVLEGPTWRANPDWGKKLGYSDEGLDEVNREAIALLSELRGEAERVVLSGCIGPRGDGYQPSARMSAEESESYHSRQIAVFRDTEADMVAAFTMNYVEEAIGIARAARRLGMPAAISFTVETDGRLPTGQSLREAVEATDESTEGSPAYYMVNCAHPTHFIGTLESAPWLHRIRGVRANSSRRSHEELNESTELDVGDPEELGRLHADLMDKLKGLCVVGGCCGTDHRHVDSIYRSCAGVSR